MKFCSKTHHLLFMKMFFVFSIIAKKILEKKKLKTP